MLLDLLIYFSFLFFSFFYASQTAIFSKNKNYWNITTFLPLLFFSMIFGVRYNVGTDFQNYVFLFEKNINTGKYDFYRLEPFFRILILILNKLNLQYYFFFLITFLIQYFFLYLSFKKNTCILKYSLFFFITTFSISYLNIIRQGVAVTIILYAYLLLSKKKYFQFLVTVIFAALFHKTAFISCIVVLLLPLCLIEINKKIIYILLLITLFCQDQILSIIFDLYNSMVNILPILNSFPKLNPTKLIKAGSGLGILLQNFEFILIIFLFNKNNKKHILFFIIFVFGAFIQNIAGYNLIFARIPMYFTICKIFVCGDIMKNTFIYWKNNATLNKIAALIVIVINIVMFTSAIVQSQSNCSPYQFYFMNN